MKSTRFFEAALGLLLLAACGTKAPDQSAAKAAARFDVARSEPLPDTRVTTGTVRSTNVSPLAANVMGNVTRVLVAEGDRVHAGQLLLEIDDREMRAKRAQAAAGSREAEEAIAAADAGVAAAEAAATVANATFRRFSALKDRGSVSAQEYEEVAARKQAADAALSQAARSRDALIARRAQAKAGVVEAETFLSYASVRAPISGIVTARMIDPGAQAAPGMPLLTVEDDTALRVETAIDESFAALVHTGDRATIEGTITGRVTNIAAVDPQSHAALVKIALPAHSALRSGAFVHVAFNLGSRDGITIPAAAVERHGQLTNVRIIGADGAAQTRIVSLGARQGDRIEVLAGIDPGEKVLIAEGSRL